MRVKQRTYLPWGGKLTDTEWIDFIVTTITGLRSKSAHNGYVGIQSMFSLRFKTQLNTGVTVMRYRLTLIPLLLLLSIAPIPGAPTETVAIVRMIDPIDSNKNQVGETFRGTLEASLQIDRQTVAPKGTPVTVQLVHVKQSGQLKGREEIVLQLLSLTIEGDTFLVRSQFAEVASESKGEESAQVIGGAAAIGAIVGAITGGKKGAAIGAATGAGAGAAIQLVRGKQVYVPSESLLSFQLEDLARQNEAIHGTGVVAVDVQDYESTVDEAGARDYEEPYVFDDRQETIVRDWFSNRQNLKGLPPGLAKRNQLPHGLQRQLQKNGSLPPGLQKRIQLLPVELERLLPDLPHSIQRGMIGVDVVLMDKTSMRVLDIIRQVLS